MRIAVTHENGKIFEHFGKTEEFKIYETEEGKFISSKIVKTMGEGHGALIVLLKKNDVDVLICGGIGGGAKNALNEFGIKLYAGVTGSADEAVNAFLENNLMHNPNVKCNHHDSHHHGNDKCHGPEGCNHRH